IGKSPVRVQLRLSAAGMRPVSNAVDASNYVMLEMGKPIHVFDAGSVSGGTIVVRPAQAGEKLETLDHVVRSLTPDDIVIADASGAIGIAGVMGGANSEVSSNTTAAFVESAVFDPVSIRRTAFRYGLRSEASLRFEKGQESRLARLGADRTVQLLAQWAGGRPAVGAIDTNPEDEMPRRVAFRPARISRLLGQNVTPAEMIEALAAVEIKATPAGDGEELPDGATVSESLVAIVPTHRRDIAIEADVAEEVCRVRGYDTLPPRLPETRLPAYRRDPRQFKDALRDLLSGRGLSEVVTNGLIAPVDHERVGIPPHDAATIRVANPVTADHSELRRTLLPGMLGVVARNERQRGPHLAIYEMGNVQEWRDGEPREVEVLGVMLAGNWRAASWAEPARSASLEDLKGIVETLLARAGVGDISYGAADVRAGVEHPGRTALIASRAASSDEGAVLGRVFEVDPRLGAAYDVRAEHVVFAILDVAVMARIAADRGVPKVRDVARLPVIERDIAVVVGRDVSADRVAEVVRATAGSNLVTLELFDRYTGAPLEAGQVSLAYRLRFQPGDEAMSEAAIDGAISAVTAALEHEVGGRIRSGS
ncbi:MAG TPA: phenylalanine--tRNA ligase subunit beta, partial [Candidatus Limnocylindrales bacterium]|nr:phenylalanine--tRNA ligase subunit beta [Candidatus Limnocylindrales bacterium]